MSPRIPSSTTGQTRGMSGLFQSSLANLLAMNRTRATWVPVLASVRSTGPKENAWRTGSLTIYEGEAMMECGGYLSIFFFFFFPDLVNKVIMMNDCTMSLMVPIVG